MTTEQQPDPVVTQAAERFDISVDDRPAGFAEFVDHGGQRIFHHTEIGSDFAGRGLAGALVSQALIRTRAAGLRVVPVCPFVAGYIDKHPEFADITDPVTPEAEDHVHSRNRD
ncbi:GNAT family N-acetyltransferase [Nocardia vermiculata]|uniref:N-acetyltransferase n=1 Tax=Nocardia vermiculata TaxID=257274 RepID=A0A846XW43_9NOCA|nr:GNAT family N-acetyltransferase [Nocardia vermiculata]NKY49885.1 N-acetyltransferase [Nocardia vermiculata]